MHARSSCTSTGSKAHLNNTDAELECLRRLRLTEKRSASNSSLSASMSTASCSSPKLLTHAVPAHDAVRTCEPGRAAGASGASARAASDAVMHACMQAPAAAAAAALPCQAALIAATAGAQRPAACCRDRGAATRRQRSCITWHCCCCACGTALAPARRPQLPAGTLNAMVRSASLIDISSWRSLGSGVASTRNSARLSPSCECRSRVSAQACQAAARRPARPTAPGLRTLALACTAFRRDAARAPRTLALTAEVNAPAPVKALREALAATLTLLARTRGRATPCSSRRAS